MMRIGVRAGAGCRFRRTLLAFITATAIAVPASAESLSAIVREALRNHPELGAIRFNRKAIDQELRAARGLGLPTFDLKSNLGRIRNTTRTGTGIKTNEDWHNHRDLSLIMSQRVFDGFERRYEVVRQKNRVESSRWRVADTANSIALRTVQAYFELQRASTVLRVAQSNLSALLGLQARVHERVRAGLGDAGERSEAGSRVANAKALLIEAKAKVADARALFRAAVGRDPGRLSGFRFPRHALPRNVELAVAEARRAAPSVIATEHDRMAAEAAIGTARSRLYPKLNLELSSNHGIGVDQKDDYQVDARALVVVRWNIFNGGIDSARIREAYARAGEASGIAENTRRIVERETRASWIAMTSARQRIPVLRQQLQLARKTRQTYIDQFDTGSRRLLDLLDAQSEIFTVEASLRTEEFVGHFNGYRVLAAMGRLVWALGLEMPDEAVRPYRHSVLDGWKTHVRHE